MLRDTVGCYELLMEYWDAMRYYGMLWSAKGCYGMLWSAMEC